MSRFFARLKTPSDRAGLAIVYLLLVGAGSCSIVCYAWAQRDRLARSYARAAHRALSMGDLSLARAALGPARADGFFSVRLEDEHGRKLLELSRDPAGSRDAISFRLVSHSRDVDSPRELAATSPSLRFETRLGLGILVPVASSLALLAGVAILLATLRRRRHEALVTASALHRSRIERRRARQAAHDIRSPISALNVVLARGQFIAGAERELIVRAAGRIHDIADGLLGPTRNIAGGSVAPADANEIVRQVHSELAALHGSARGLRLRLDLDESVAADCAGDPTELTRAVSNLATNAVEAVGGRGGVTLAVHHGADAVSIVIADDGRGIPIAIREQLGRRRITYGKGEAGHGLGVWHAAETARAGGGELEITSREGSGTVVTLRMPRSRSGLDRDPSLALKIREAPFLRRGV